MMDPYQQLFLLPDEIMRYSVFSKLSWKDLVNVDEAMNNRELQEQFNRWLQNARKDLLLVPETDESILNWIARKGVNIKMLSIKEDVEERLWMKCAGFHVEQVALLLDKLISTTAATTVMTTMRGVRNIYVTAVKSFNGKDLWTNLLVHQPKLRRFHFYHFGTQHSGSGSEQLLEDFAEYCLEIMSLVLYDCARARERDVVRLVQRCQQLEGCQLNGCTAVTELSLQAIGQNCANMREVLFPAGSGIITDAGLLPLLQGCRKLIYLHLWDCSGITDRSIVALGGLAAQLMDVSLPKCRALGTAAAEAALKKLCKLITFNVAWSTNISEQLLLTVIHNNPTLHNIDLSGVATASDAVVSAIGSGCKGLWSLYIPCCALVTDLMPLSTCFELHTLHIHYCRSLREETLLQLAATPGPQRINVYVYGCNISEDALERLQSTAEFRVDLQI